jgi:hypothetical protein
MQRQGRDALRLSKQLKAPQGRPLGRFCGIFYTLLLHLFSSLKVLISTSVRKKAVLAIALLLVPAGVLFSSFNHPKAATAAPSNYLNFQARLLNSAGNLVPDGTYNIEFKLFNASSSSGSSQGSCSGDANCEWTETRTSGNRVNVVNGYLSVNLGSVTAFGGSIDWSQQQWLTMNIGGTGSPGWDGEMTPRIQLTAIPLAFVANNVASGGTNASSTNSANVSIQSGNAAGATSNSGNITLDVGTATGTKGTISIGTANTSALSLGNTSGTSLITGSTLTLQSGGNILLGTSDTTGTLLVLDTKTGSGDPTGVNGGMYYNSNAGKFRCYEASAWKDCDGAGSGVTTIGALNGGTANATGATISSNTLYLQSASVTYAGLVDTTTQSFAGDKTFTGILVVSGNAPNSANGASLTVTGNLTSTTNEQSGISSAPVIAPGSSSARTYSGFFSNPSGSSSNITGSIYGFTALPAYTGTTTIGSLLGYYGLNFNASTGTVGTAASFYAANPINNGTITNNYGLYVATQTVGGNDYGVYIQGADTYALWVDSGATQLDGTLSVLDTVTIGTSDTTGTLLVLDTKTGSGDPSGVNGGMYYNSNAGKFRCYQASAWTDCIGAGGGSLFTDAGSYAYLTATGDELVFGSSTQNSGVKLTVTNGGANATGGYGSSIVANFRNSNNSTDYAGISIQSGISGGAFIDFGDNDAEQRATIVYDNNTEQMHFYADSVSPILSIDATGINAAEELTVGTSDTTGTLLVLDTKTGSGDPTGVNGGMYYNSNAGKFRCYEASAWKDCDGAGSGVTTIGALNGGTANATGATISSNTLYLQSASVTYAGLVDTTTQSFAGDKTFTGILVVSGNAPNSANGASLTVTGNLTSTTNEQSGISSAPVIAPGSSSARTYSGFFSNPSGSSSNITGSIYGFTALPAYTGTTTIGSLLGYYGLNFNASTGTVGTAASFYAANPINNGTITNNYGLYVATQTVGGNDYGVYIQGADTYALWVDSGATQLDGTLSVLDTVTIGTSDTTGTLLVLDTKTGSGDPSGVNGGMYYNSNAGKFRCYQASAWTDCIGAGGGSLFTDAGSYAYLTATGDELVFGSSTQNSGVKLTVTNGGANATGGYGSSIVANFRNSNNSTDYAGISIQSGISGGAFIDFGDNDAEQRATIVYDNNTEQMHFYADSVSPILSIDATGINAAEELTVGTSDTTGTLLVLDTKTGSGDPTGVNGGMYYNSNAGKFRCYEASAWTDCISSGSGVTTIGAIDTTPTAANGARISGSSLFMQYADASFPGLVSTTTQSFAGNKTFTGNLTVSGATTLNGNTTLGDATSDTITFTGRVNSDILPTTDDTYNLGDNTHRWANLYLGGETLHIGSSTSDEAAISYNNSSDSLIFKNATNSATAFQIQNSSSAAFLTADTSNNKVEVVGDVYSKGLLWAARTSAADNAWQSVAYGNGMYVAVGSGGTDRVMTSQDGIIWTSRSVPSSTWLGVTYGNGIFVAVGDSAVMTSIDGITWTARTSPASNGWYGVTYANGLFVAVAGYGTGTPNRAMTSPDGITWTAQTTPNTNSYISVTYGNGLFVAVAYSGTGNRVMTSPDGVTWTAQTSAADIGWASVTYANGLFVAVGQGTVSNSVMTSPDGTSWTLRTLSTTNTWRGVAYGNGLFVAVGDDSSTARIMSSPDGITWTTRTAPSVNQWHAITYANGMFVSVAQTGTGDRVMTSGHTETTETLKNNIYQGGMTVNGDTLFKSSVNSSNAFQLQNASGVNLFVADTTTNRISVLGSFDAGEISSPYGGFGQYSNYLSDSEAFDDTGSWTQTALTSVTSDPADATNPGPNLLSTADKIISNGTVTTHSLSQISGLTGAGTYTFSVWLKANSGTAPVQLRVNSASGTPTTGTASSFTLDTTWRRYSVTQTFTGSTGNITVFIILSNQTETVAAFGAQFIDGSTPGVYTPMDNSAFATGTRSSGLLVNGNLRLASNSSKICIGIGDSNAATCYWDTGMQVPSGVGSTYDMNLSFLNFVYGGTSTVTLDTQNSTIRGADVSGAVGIPLSLKGGAANGSNRAGGLLTLQGGAGSGSGTAGGVTIQGGTNATTNGVGGAVSITSGAGGSSSGNSGALTIASGTASGTGTAGNISIDVGTSGSGNGSILIGNAARAQTITVGNSTGSTTMSLISGSGGTNLQSAANITIGVSDTTGTLLVLDTKTGSGDPTGVAGGMYYNSNSAKFRCYENGAWTNCITTIGNSLTIGDASNAGSLLLSDGSSNTITLTAGGIGTNYSLTFPTTAGTTSKCLMTDSSVASQLIFGTCSTGAGDGGATSLGAVDGQAANGNGGSIVGTIFYQQSASASNPGLVNTTTQTFAGDKTFSGTITVANITPSANLTIGTSDTTGTLLILDTKTGAGDPTGVNGGMYYNSDSNNFRCRHNGLWQDCDYASLRAEWALQEDWSTQTISAGTTTTLGNIGTNGWTFVSTGVGVLAKVNSSTDASDRDRFGIIQFGTPATSASGVSLSLGQTSMAGTPANTTIEFDFGPNNAAAADGTQTITRIGLVAGSTASTQPTDGIYFQYSTTTTAGNWFRCTRNNGTETCTDTGVARTLTNNVYQRFRIQTNSAGTAAEFFINESSVGTNSTNLPASTRALGPTINTHTVNATVRTWKMDYFQIKRNLTTLR